MFQAFVVTKKGGRDSTRVIRVILYVATCQILSNFSNYMWQVEKKGKQIQVFCGACLNLILHRPLFVDNPFYKMIATFGYLNIL